MQASPRLSPTARQVSAPRCTFKPLRRCGFLLSASITPCPASSSTKGSVALFNAKAEVRATAPEVLHESLVGGAVQEPVRKGVTQEPLQVLERGFVPLPHRLDRVRRERDADAVGVALAGLRDAARRPGSSETNLMPHFIRCADAYATLGEQCRVLREVFGEYREPVAV